ncbi:NAD(P)H-hydrate dehydratase [Chitinimonas sp. BJYL2]|uniref:NAD(P)H-hydrate dehydratase n=1 Tax=Chitinimonas sp. BJYL2 TaxID=2976696 RepID=UPI0022B3C225|nr:NAD(P)H-hydrate dehydratase [Chitinimonas sp. BJYL2]
MYYTVSQLRDMEQRATHEGLSLMPLAGAAAARFICARFGPAAHVLCLAGPGNNGGDALVCARLLKQRGMAVEVLLPVGPAGLPADAAAAHAAWLDAGGTCSTKLVDAGWQVVVDGLFGIGLNRALDDTWQTLVDQINAMGKPVLALDVPSGLHADSGAALGRPILARWTLSMMAPVRGLLTGAGPDHAGERHTDTLGLDARYFPMPAVCDCHGITLPRRVRDSHKGRFGSVLIVGGAPGMAGAALLAGRAAAHAGAGKVHIGLLDHRVALDPLQPELMLAAADARQMAAANVMVIGPGLGTDPAALVLLDAALHSACPLVVDADALNLIARDAALRAALYARGVPTVITPHPAEAARLLGCTTEAIQAKRYDAARALANGLGVTAILKGQGSVIDNGSHTAVNDTGSAALANGGQGDVLSGLLAALLAQGMSPWDAARLACQVHGAASDALQAATGQWVTLASEVAVAAGVQLGRHRAHG